MICKLIKLQVLHQPPSIFHRDIRWDNVLRRADNPSLWFLIDWDDASGSDTVAANHLSEENHSPRVFVDNHGGEVDVWRVGRLIVDSAKFGYGIPSALVDLGRWMMQDVAPTTEQALLAVRKFASGHNSP
jgi:hypothetical protein